MARKRITERLKQFDILVLLIAVILFLTIIAIFIRARTEEQNIQNQDPIQQLQRNPIEQEINEKLDPNDKPEFDALLSAMPYTTSDFTATYLPLEPNVDPKIQVEVNSVRGKEKFLEWYRKFNISKQLDIQYLYDDPPIEDHTDSNV